MRTSSVILGAVLAAAPAAGADVPAAGQSPLGGPGSPAAGAWWAGWSNDTFGAPTYDQRDDYRSNRLQIGWQATGWLRVSIDHSMLIDANPSGEMPDWSASDPLATYFAGGARSDELSASAVATWSAADPAAMLASAWAGPGLRWAGNLGGEAMQDANHAVMGVPPVDLPYEDPDPALAGLLAAGADGTVAGLWWSAAQTLTTTGEWSAAVHLRWRAGSPVAGWWLGPGWLVRSGDGMTTVADHVADNEAGPWLETGLDAGPFALSAGKRIDDEAVYGAITVVTRRRDGAAAGPPLVGEVAALKGVDGWTGPGNGVSTSARWLLPLDGWLAGRLSAGGTLRRYEHLVPYHFSNRAESYELLASAELAGNPPTGQGFAIDPFISGGIGWYWGRARVIGDPAVSEDADLSTPRLRGALGLRTWYASRPPGRGGWTAALGGALDLGWSPDAHEVVYDPTAGGAPRPPSGDADPDRLVRLGGWSAGYDLRMTVRTDW